MSKNLKDNSSLILEFLKSNPSVSSGEIHAGIEVKLGYATLKRRLQKLISANLIITHGQGKGTKYLISPVYELVNFIDDEEYFQREIDERNIKESYNHSLIKDTLSKVSVFTDNEFNFLNSLQKIYTENISKLTVFEYKKELERLAIDLSWKSSQIEGNTYSLLETERLLREKETASGKTKEEAIMLLNHKDAWDFIIENPTYVAPLTVSGIEDIHSILIKELYVDRNIRRRRVGISGTNYKPLDNEFQIREALRDMCSLVNKEKKCFFESFSCFSITIIYSSL